MIWQVFVQLTNLIIKRIKMTSEIEEGCRLNHLKIGSNKNEDNELKKETLSKF